MTRRGKFFTTLTSHGFQGPDRMKSHHPKHAVIVEFQATRPDGCVSLELNSTIKDLQAKGIELSEGLTLQVWEPSAGDDRVSEGVVHWDEDWGWGIEIDRETLRRFQS